MAAANKEPADLEYFDGLHPTGNGRQTYTMRKGLMHQYLHNVGPDMFLSGYFITEILDKPGATFGNLKRPGLENGYCLSGTPKIIVAALKPPPGFVLCVFVNGNFRIINYGWDKECNEFAGSPSDARDPERFGVKLWPQ